MIFISIFRKYRIVLRPQRAQIDGFGNRTTVEGIKCEFNDYKYETTDKEIIKALKAHKSFGFDFRSEDSTDTNSEGEVEEQEEENSIEKLLTSCPHCAFKAVNEFGLRAHIRAKHSQE